MTTAAARSRGFADLNMPPGSSDKSQQPMGSAFPGSNLYPNKSIWTSSLSNARERSIGSKDSEGSPSGSSALAANSEADVWGSGSNPWNTESSTRSVSTSPNRCRDTAIPNGPGFFDHAPAAIGVKKGGFGGSKIFADDPSVYGQAFASQKRPAAAEASYMDQLAAYPQARDSSLPPSRQTQGSPAAFPEYRRGHTPSNSIHSQRGMPSTAGPSFTNHSVNQRAFNLNKQIDDDLSLHLRGRLNMDHNRNNINNAAAFNSTPPPSQLNPGCQPWTDASSTAYDGSLKLHTESMPAYSVMKRGSMDRISPSAEYYLPSGGSSQNFAASPESWPARPSSSRDAQGNGAERCHVPQQLPAGFAPTPSFYPSQYSFPPNLPPQYAQSLLDLCGQGQPLRHNMIPAYNLGPVPPVYGIPTSLPPIRPSRDQDPGKGVRSALLDEFRSSHKSSKRYDLKDIYNHVVEFSGDQHGSRFIQQKLESANSDEKDRIFREIEPNAVQLMKDVFGNYVVQKFFEHGNQIQKKVLAEKMRGRVMDLSMQVYACRVVQKALEHVLVEQQAELTKELEVDVVRVIRDQNGNHVVQKIIELVPRQHMDFIMDSVRGQVIGLASHAYGCRVIQRMLEHGSETDKRDLMLELHASAQMLMTDQYGNYVAQHVVQHGKAEDRARMIDLVLAQLLTLSKHKFASNVVEKCLEHATAEQRTNIRELLLSVGPDGSLHLQSMVRDQYGNYVIQKLLGLLHGSEREMLMEEIRPLLNTIKKNSSSRQLQALEKLLETGPGGPATRNDGPSSHADDNSAADTPALTNETSSPQSSSPRSAHISAVGIPSEDDGKSGLDGDLGHLGKLPVSLTPQFGEEEA